MMERQLNDFIQVVGLTAQVSATILIAVFFLMLRLPGQRRAYFRFWRLAWVCLALALLVLIPQVRAEGGAQLPFSYGPYQMGKLLFLLFLLAGVLTYARGLERRRVWRVGLPATIAYGLASILLSRSFTQVMGWQIPVLLTAYASAAVLMLGLPAPRRTLGSRLTGMAMLLASLLWLANAVYTFAPAGGHAAGPGFQLGLFASRYGSFADLILQVLMSFGMVVLLFEDTGRETSEAYRRLAISNHHLERAAYIDPLTGALTRRAFDEEKGMEMAAANYGTVAMLDLDDLKAVNDAWGHETGDGLLRHAVEAMRSRLRPLDQIYRWGGDEFAVLMVQTTLAEASPRLESLLAGLPAYAPPGLPSIPVRISRGTAHFRSANSLRQALAEADNAMLEDKRRRKGSGRMPAAEKP
ncbi:MAG: GGDEF domain-containing protein [Acidobacteria bacterium]|nr:GGDEF domain-containing protein [Acidobacteriota bacterium]